MVVLDALDQHHVVHAEVGALPVVCHLAEATGRARLSKSSSMLIRYVTTSSSDFEREIGSFNLAGSGTRRNGGRAGMAPRQPGDGNGFIERP